jgi:AP2-like factor (ANT lineage)
MIKTWLKNQPAPTQQDTNNKSNGGAQSLSLSMSTGSQSGSDLPLLAVNGGGNRTRGEQSSSDNNKQQKTTPSLDSQTGAIEVVPRKSIDTFGQRTSIYRGVTRYLFTNR